MRFRCCRLIQFDIPYTSKKILYNFQFSLEKLSTTTTELKAMGFDVTPVSADIRKPKKCACLIDETINTYGQLDILINNVGLSSRGSVALMSTTNIKYLMETNYLGSAYMSKYATPHLQKTKGHIIFINSISGFEGMPYNGAQVALAEVIRIELLDAHIYVGIAYLSYTVTDPKKMILDVNSSLVY